MMRRARLFLAVSLYASLAAPAARAGELADAASETQTFSATAGTVLGAAALCDAISGSRITAATARVTRALHTASVTEEDRAEARRRFIENIKPGRDALQSGELTCERVEASLARLERLGEPAPRRTP